MTLRRLALLAPVLAVLVVAPISSAAAATRPANPKPVVDLTFDLTSTWLVTEFTADEAGGVASFSTATYSRPTAAPMPKKSALALLGFTLSPGTTTVVSVYSRKAVNDTACITASSTKTPTVLYFTTLKPRPTLVRPHGCAKPGGKPILAKPGKALIGDQVWSSMASDLKTVSIAEQSYFVDNSSYIADAGITSTSTTNDVLVAEGARISTGNTITVNLFTTDTANDSYCETAKNLKTNRLLYLSSVDDTPTRHRPAGCIVQ